MQAADPDQIRAGLHGMWATVAPAWGEHAPDVDTRAREATERMLELTAPKAGERVLELACGAGGLGLAAAELVGPDGEVVLSDVAEEMTSIAAGRADELGLRNVVTKVLDIERIEEPDGSYDVVLCRDGMMFAVEPERAAREIRRVLRPGGRFAVAVWGPRERNPWLGIVLDSVSAQLGAPVPPPGIPGPFALEDADKLDALLGAAGLTDVSIDELPVPVRVESFESWWRMTTALAGPVGNLIASLPADATEALRARAEQATKPFQTSDGLELPGVTLIATGRAA